MLKPMIISGLGVDSNTKSPVVFLKEIAGERTLPIWIGILEAQAIASELGGVKSDRPMTHDLLKTILESIDVKVNKVEICDLKDNTYFALIYIAHTGKQFTIDARPSDAIALSLRMNAPIFVSDEILNESARIVKEEKVDKWKEILEKLDPKDLGKA